MKHAVKNSLMMILIVLSLITGALGVSRVSAAGTVIIGNFPPPGDTYYSIVTSTNWLATGFTIGSINMDLEQASLRLAGNDSACQPVLKLYNNAANKPGSELATFTSPPEIAAGSPAATHSFTLATPYTLNASTIYWIVLSTNYGSCRWMEPASGVLPSGGYATYFSGALTSSGSWVTYSPLYSSYEIIGSTPPPTTVTVSNTNNSGAGSLRQAITDVAAGGTINFDNALSGQTIRLASTLTLSKNVTIDGSSLASQVSISGDADNSGSATSGDVMVMRVNTGVSATLDSLTITKGSNYGCLTVPAGIWNYGNLTINNGSITDNDAITGCNWDGGGIYSASGSTLTVTNSIFAGNKARNGAAINYLGSGLLTITNSTFSGNIGTGNGILYLGSNANFAVADSLFTGNTNTGNGVVEINHFLSQGTISGVTVSGNTSGPGTIRIDSGNVTIKNSSITGNTATWQGGGINNDIGASVTVVNSTISNNVVAGGGANWGGGIANDGTLWLYNTTLSGNSAVDLGGGIHNRGTLHYANTIVANSTSGGECVSTGTIDTNTKNLVEDGSCSATLNGDPMLDILTDNGGPTQTMALLFGSPAINAGHDATCAALPVNNLDQRGIARPIGTHCDIGAYEAERVDPTLSITNSPVTYDGTAQAAAVEGSVAGTVTNVLYDGSSTVPTDAGTYAVTADFTPDDSGLYNSLSGAFAGNFLINKADPTLSVTNSPVIFDSLPHAANVNGSVPGVVSNVLTGGAATQTSVDTYAVTADFAPTDSTNYNNLSGTAAGDFVIAADLTAPTVASIVRAGASPTNATSVTFTVTFSESVTGVDGTDFSPVISGVSGASITGAAGSGNTYTVTVNTGTGSGTLRLNVIDDDSISDAAGNLLGGTGVGNGNFTTGEVYTIDKTPKLPGKATLVSPNGSTTNNPTYNWNISPDTATEDPATWYYLYVSGPSGYVFTKWYQASDVCNAGICSAASATPNLVIGTYKWWIQSWNSIGNGPWSTGMDFTVPAPTPPGKATLVSPNSSTTSNPTYTWNKVTDATWYYLYVSGPSGYMFTKWYRAMDVCPGSTCSVPNATPGLASGSYRWWIQTWNGTTYGPWSTGMDFTVPAPTPPGKATLVSPSGSATSNPTYTWNKVSDATWYYLYVSGPSGYVFTKWYRAVDVCPGTTCSVSNATPNLGVGAYKWWIQTWNTAGYGPWSTGMNFTVP